MATKWVTTTVSRAGGAAGRRPSCATTGSGDRGRCRSSPWPAAARSWRSARSSIGRRDLAHARARRWPSCASGPRARRRSRGPGAAGCVIDRAAGRAGRGGRPSPRPGRAELVEAGVEVVAVAAGRPGRDGRGSRRGIGEPLSRGRRTGRCANGSPSGRGLARSMNHSVPKATAKTSLGHRQEERVVGDLAGVGPHRPRASRRRTSPTSTAWVMFASGTPKVSSSMSARAAPRSRRSAAPRRGRRPRSPRAACAAHLAGCGRGSWSPRRPGRRRPARRPARRPGGPGCGRGGRSRRGRRRR